MRLAVPGRGGSLRAQAIAQVRATVVARIGIEDFAVTAAVRNAKAKTVAGHRGEIQGGDQGLLLGPARKTQGRGRRTVSGEPAETAGVGFKAGQPGPLGGQAGRIRGSPRAT